MRALALKRMWNKALPAALAGLLVILLAWPALAGQCYTRCKEGPPEYNKWLRWYCDYSTGKSSATSVYASSSEDDGMQSTCALRIEGNLMPVDSARERYKNYNDCFEKFCIPAFTRLCTIENRCSNPKSWVK